MHHNDAPGLDPRTDITDLYVFQTPGNASNTVFVLNVNPKASAAAFDPEASYELKIDTDGDFEAEIAFHLAFSDPAAGPQTATVFRLAGAAARGAGAGGEAILRQAPVSFTREAAIAGSGPYRFFAGLRSEPFFADPDGFFNNLQWSGRDYWAGNNVFAIVLEVPNTALGPRPEIGVWGRTLARVHGALTPVNQMGRPGNNIFRQGADTNTTPPTEQRGRYLGQYVAMFESFGYPEAEATALGRAWLPDILPYNYTSAAGYPNGRQLADDVIDEALAIMTRGAMRDDRVTAHTDYLTEFPYLGLPHKQSV